MPRAAFPPQDSTSPHPFVFHLAEAGSVSAAVYDAQQRMVRELARGAQFDAGQHRLEWDGLDRYGRPVPPAEYEWRLNRTPGLTREFLLSVGTNPTWAPFDLWPGNHSGPGRLLVDRDNRLYLAAVWSEVAPNILKLSLDGREKFWSAGWWGIVYPPIGMALVGPVLYTLLYDGSVDALNADTGKIQTRHFADLIHPADPESKKKVGERRPGFDAADPHELNTSFAGGPGFLMAAYRKYNDVRFFRLDPGGPRDHGSARLVKSVEIPEPKGCCVCADGRVLVVSGRTVLRVDPESGRFQPVITDPELTSPVRVAWDQVNDDLLVLQHGPGVDDVRRYHAPTGRLVASYGRPEGRSWGVFEPLDFGGLLDIAADGQGGFFTAEEFPRRVAHFRGREQHALVAQWFGGVPASTMSAVDPQDVSTVYVFPDSEHCGRGRIDYANRTWTLTHLYARPDWVNLHHGRDAMFPRFGGLSFWEVRHVAGSTFLVNTGHFQMGCAAVIRVDERRNCLMPVAFLGGVHPSFATRPGAPSWWLAAMNRAGYDPTHAYEHLGFSWSDTNRDGKIDAAEIRLGSIGRTWNEAHCFIDSQWNVYYALRPGYPPLSDMAAKIPSSQPARNAWLFIPNEGAPDLPVWDWNHAKLSAAGYPEWEKTLGASVPAGIFRDREGNTYTACNGEVNKAAQDVPPRSWPNNSTAACRVHKWNSAGTLEWSVGLHTAEPDRLPGEFSQIRGILGEVNDCIVVLDGRDPASVWTKDGLFAGSLCARRADDGLDDVAYNRINGNDNQWGDVAKNPQGEVLWGGNGDNNILYYRVRGWDRWERLKGKLVVEKPAQPARRRGSGLQAAYFSNPDLSGAPSLQRVDPVIWFGAMGAGPVSVAAPTSGPAGGPAPQLPPGVLSARWTGFFEPPLSEDFTFVAYTYGRPLKDKLYGSRIRLWVGDRMAVDEWSEVVFQFENLRILTRTCKSAAIPLRVGQLTPIRLEYAAAGGANAHVHLFVGSSSLDERHIPAPLLYPQAPQ